jgi:hypothetical protein
VTRFILSRRPNAKSMKAQSARGNAGGLWDNPQTTSQVLTYLMHPDLGRPGGCSIVTAGAV